MADAAPPRVFISYSHDSAEHRDRVLDLASRLRDDGIDAMIDQYVQFPPEGWPNWCEAQIRRADFVLMVCTEVYLRRVNGEEEPGKGHGIRWEGHLNNQHLYDAGSMNRKFVPLLFAWLPRAHPHASEGRDHLPRRDRRRIRGPRRLLTDQPLTPIPAIGQRRRMPPKARQSAGSALVEPSKSAASLPHPRVEDLFVGRSAEREKLAAALFPTNVTRRPVVVSGMAGVGKSYLVDRFFWENAARFPGGYPRLAFDPDKPATAADFVATLSDRLKLKPGDDQALLARLLMPLTLVHVENADTPEAGHIVADLANSLPGCALIISARLRGLGADAGWREVALAPFETATALEQLQAELGAGSPGQESWPSLAEALGRLPLALHLAAGHLRADRRPEAFLRRLRAKKLALTGADPADPTFRQRSRALFSDTFELSLDALHREGGSDGEQWLAGICCARSCAGDGVGESLGAAISGVAPEIFDDLVIAAARLFTRARTARRRNCLSPPAAMAELLRPRADKDKVTGRMTEWFLARLPEASEDQGQRWRELGDETGGLDPLACTGLAGRPVRVEGAGSWYAILNGPYHAWLMFCEALLPAGYRTSELSNTSGPREIARRAGDLDRALDVAKQKRDLATEDRGAERRDAATRVRDHCRYLCEGRGQLDEALKIRNEEQLPVYERLGDVRARAVTMGKIADILQARGQLDEALKIHNQEQLPVYQRLGDVRSRAVTMGQIADILQARGQLDEALKIRNQEQFPVYERLGDVRARAVTMGKIADILQARGQLDEALKIRSDEVLPAFKHLGDPRLVALEMGRIADILQARGQLDEALKIRNEEELPVYERLGDARSRAVTMGQIADICRPAANSTRR